MNVRRSPTPVSDDKCARFHLKEVFFRDLLCAAQSGGHWLTGIVIFQVQEPTGNDEYEVCDPEDSEY